MTDPRACKVCPFLRPEDSLSLEEVAEFENLDWFLTSLKPTPREAARYTELYHKRYFPPCDLERMGVA